jgi:hypothetical protein
VRPGDTTACLVCVCVCVAGDRYTCLVCLCQGYTRAVRASCVLRVSVSSRSSCVCVSSSCGPGMHVCLGSRPGHLAHRAACDYPSQGAVCPSQGAVYTSQGAVYPSQGAVYPSQGAVWISLRQDHPNGTNQTEYAHASSRAPCPDGGESGLRPRCCA